MGNSRTLIYDGSFNGFLTAVHVAFYEELDVVGFQKVNCPQKGLFAEVRNVVSCIDKAKQVWTLFERKGNSIIRTIYFAFLSETLDIDFKLYTYMRGLHEASSGQDHDQVRGMELRIQQLSKLVSREKKTFESRIDFEANNPYTYSAEVSPTFNVLPLISRYFRNKYPKHPWIIFDTKRNYGLYYDLTSVKFIDSDTRDRYLGINPVLAGFSDSEYKYAV